MVLLGAQALLGFQFAIFLMETFDKIPDSSKYIHLTSLVFTALCIIIIDDTGRLSSDRRRRREHRIFLSIGLADGPCGNGAPGTRALGRVLHRHPSSDLFHLPRNRRCVVPPHLFLWSLVRIYPLSEKSPICTNDPSGRVSIVSLARPIGPNDKNAEMLRISDLL